MEAYSGGGFRKVTSEDKKRPSKSQRNIVTKNSVQKYYGAEGSLTLLCGPLLLHVKSSATWKKKKKGKKKKKKARP